MSNKKFKLVLPTENLELCDFEKHALKNNIASSVTGGFPKVTHAKTLIIRPYKKAY